MNPAAVTGTLAGILATATAVMSLRRGALRQPWPDRRPYRWLTAAAGLVLATMIVAQAVTPPAGDTAVVVSFADLPALLFLVAIVAGLVGLASGARDAAAEAQSPPRRGLGTVLTYLADGYVLAAALFLIGWVTLFGHAFAGSAESAGAFAGELVHPLADLVVLGAALPIVQAAGRRGVPPYLALLAMTIGDSLSVGARVGGTRPGVAAMAAQLAAAGLLAAAPWASTLWSAGTRWIGGAREVTTTAAAAAAAVAGLLVLVHAMAIGHLPEPVEFTVLVAVAVTLAVRVVSLVRRVDTWSRVWQESGRQFRQLAERTSDVVLLCDLDGTIRYASRDVAGYGYTAEILRGTTLADLLHPEDRAGGMRAVRRAILGKAQRIGRYPCRVRAADGTWRHVQSTVSRYLDPGQPDLLLVTARDMSAQVALRRQVTHLTFHDSLTGLPNRAYVEQRAQDVLGQARHAAARAAGRDEGDAGVAGVIVLGMDGLTAVNDEHGHAVGDLLLAQVARRLRLAVSPQDTVARWGGDEFAVLTESAGSAAELVDIGERLARTVAALPFRVGDNDQAATACVGVALADGSPAAHVWRNAEMALARAKAAGGGRVETYPPGQDGPGGAVPATAGAAHDDPAGAGERAPGAPGGEDGHGAAAGLEQSGAAGPGSGGDGVLGSVMDHVIAAEPGAGRLDAIPGPAQPGPVASAVVGETAETPAGAGA